MNQWWTNGALHREDGPAIEYEDGTREWYLLGIQVIEDVVKDVVQRERFYRLLSRLPAKTGTSTSPRWQRSWV